MMGNDTVGVFSDPCDQFELIHNQLILQGQVADGHLLAFHAPSEGEGVIYSPPGTKAFDLLANGLEQLSLEQLKARHRAIMTKRFPQEFASLILS